MHQLMHSNITNGNKSVKKMKLVQYRIVGLRMTGRLTDL